MTDHIAVRTILDGVRDRAEGWTEPLFVQMTEFAVYVFAARTFAAACLLVLIRPLRWQGVLVAGAAGLTWLIVWYAPIWLFASLALELETAFAVVTVLLPRRRSLTAIKCSDPMILSSALTP